MFMTTSLFERVVGMLERIEFSGRLSFHLFGEPLLRDDLDVLVSWARPRLHMAYFVLYTNGDLLNNARYESLLAAGIDHFKVTRHGWDTFPERPFQSVRHPNHFTVSGRGGVVARETSPLKIACHAPSEMLIVTVNGDVLLCHEDAACRHVMGNLAKQDLEEVWVSTAFQSVRHPLEAGRRGEGTDTCARCDNRRYPLPGAAI
jgi:2-deoxy-scyllo-inosamine dehydrogenase (SAM-dependent)